MHSRTNPDYHPSCKLRPVLDYVNSVSMHYYTPKQGLSLENGSFISGTVAKANTRIGEKVY